MAGVVVNKLERQGISRLIDTFGAEILVSVPEYLPLTKLHRAKLRVAVDEQIAGCTNCELHTTCHAPVTPRWPGVLGRAQITIVGESPTLDDDNKHTAYSGRVGRMVRSGLQQVGIDPDDVVYTYVNSCRCHSEGVPRPPTSREQAHCRENLLSTLQAADARYVLLFGATSVKAWRDDVKLTDVAGKLFVWGKWFVWPMWSPQAVLCDTHPLQLWRGQLAQFAQVVVDDAGVDALYGRCIECAEPVFGYDSGGLPWCRAHLPKHVGKAATQEQRRGKYQVNQLAIGL